MPENRLIPVAFFSGTLLVFVYLLLAAPVGGPPDLLRASTLGALFRYGLDANAIATIAFRSLLVFLAGFNLTWLFLSLRANIQR
jgi:hypothetical protein